MDIRSLLISDSPLGSPAAFAVLCGLATWLALQAFSPARPVRKVQDRLDGYLDAQDIVDQSDISEPFMARVILPLMRGLLRLLGRAAPGRAMEETRQMLEQAGRPGGLTVLDFWGLRLLASVCMGGYCFWMMSKSGAFTDALLGVAVGAGLGFMLPNFWLRGRIKKRANNITKALPNALDMLTIGVEAGLAFESAMVRVVERWDSDLSREFRRAIIEMRVGASREEALRRLAERADVPELRTFVAVLIQSTQLGVSITDVLHTQAAQIREKRRLRAEELARKAGVKIMIPLVFLILPAMFVVVLGPALPTIMGAFGNLGGG